MSSLQVLQDGTPAPVNVTLTRPSGNTKSITLTVQSTPNFMNAHVQSPGKGNAGTVTFWTGGPLPLPGMGIPFVFPTPGGTYNVKINASDGTTTGSASLTLEVAVVSLVAGTVDNTQGVNGQLDLFMSTSFQPADWSDTFFQNNPGATTPLAQLNPQHIRIQALARDIPMTSAGIWDFTHLDAMMNPILSASQTAQTNLNLADNGPEFQIARAPDFMYLPSPPPGTMPLADATFQQFAGYAADLVDYYDSPSGIQNATQCATSAGAGAPCKSSGALPIHWWGIYNEPNINGFSADQYVAMYNTLVPAMQAADTTHSLKFAAVELADFPNGFGNPDEAQKYMPTFVQNVTAQVDAVAVHYYPSCNQRDPDQQLFDGIDWMAGSVRYVYSQLQSSGANPALNTVPVWMTENNVNADYDKGGRISACNGSAFTLDPRGSSAFFAAWRPTAFSKFGKVGLRALYHWDFNADTQFGEVNQQTAGKYLSYWVDYWLQRMFPSGTGISHNILTQVASESTIETLATQRGDGSVVIMVANHAVKSATDDNGPGDARKVMLDISALGSFSKATLVTLDAQTDITNGPSATSVTPAPRMEIDFGGYGVAFMVLTP